MQLRQQVGEMLGRCVDEVKLIAFDRQLEARMIPNNSIKNKIDLYSFLQFYWDEYYMLGGVCQKNELHVDLFMICCVRSSDSYCHTLGVAPSQ